MGSIDWHQTGLLVGGVVMGVLLLVVAWKAVKFLFKVFVALLFLVLLGLTAWYWTHASG
jgi:multisubunit Na+/H+ antiporter MnhB subunit